MRTLLLALIAAVAVGGIAVAQQSPAPSPSPEVMPSVTVAAFPAPVTVHIHNFSFDPESITVAVGQGVRFVEDDETGHTVTAADASFDSGNLEQRGTWVHAFGKPGTYKYYCAYHPYMKGEIVVK